MWHSAIDPQYMPPLIGLVCCVRVGVASSCIATLYALFAPSVCVCGLSRFLRMWPPSGNLDPCCGPSWPALRCPGCLWFGACGVAMSWILLRSLPRSTSSSPSLSSVSWLVLFRRLTPRCPAFLACGVGVVSSWLPRHLACFTHHLRIQLVGIALCCLGLQC